MPPSRSLFGTSALAIALVGLVTVSYQGMRSRLTGQVGGGSGQCAVIQEFPVPAASGGGAGWLETLAVGPDGNLWYGGLRLNTVGRMTPSGTVTEFPLPTPGTYVRNIVAGPDGNLWFTVNTSQNTTNTIGKITTAGVITEYPAPAGSGPYEIVKGPDGNLWFTQAQSTSKIGTITTAGVISEHTVPPGTNVQTLGMTVGPDGHLWFTRNGAKLGRVSTSGTFSEYPLPGPATGIGAITSGPDDHLWYAGYWYTKIGKMSTSGTATEFALPTHQYQGLPTTSTRIRGLTAGPDGNVWYAGEGGNGDGFIGRVTPAGTIDEYPVPTANGAAGAIITGPDNAIWFTEFHANKIGRLTFGSCPGSSSAPASSAGQCGVQNPAYQLFNDSTMADASWDWTQVDPAHPASVQGYQPTGGNPGSWRKITHAAVGPSDVTLTGTMNRYKNASFNPQTEQFISASLTMDAFINAPASSNNLEVGLVAHQNGTWFRKVGLVVGSTWQIFETSVTAAELQAGGIDLSPSGAPITFGFETGNGYVEANNVVGVDKVAVKIISSIRCPDGSSSAASSTPKPNMCYPKCGDGIKHALEECDDGNTTNGDGCSDKCKKETSSSSSASSCAAQATITEYPIPIPGAQAHYVGAGPDGNVWFTDAFGSGHVGKVTPSGIFTVYNVPPPIGAPQDIVTGPDGNLWFAAVGNPDSVGKVTPTGAFTGYPLPTASAVPVGIAAGPDGNLWVTEQMAKKIAKVTPSGAVTEYPIPSTNATPNYIVRGPDGNLWFSENNANKIGRITPAGAFTEFPIPTQSANPSGITVGPDGNLWFAETFGNKIGRITTSGTITEFAVSGNPHSITRGPDGNLWFTENTGNKIGRMTTGGVLTEYSIPTANSGPRDITVGPDGNIWFIEFNAAKMGKITVPCPSSSSAPSSQASSSGPVCGNGKRESPEECDDGNKTNGDCCSSTCKVEPGCRCFASDCKCPAGQYWTGSACVAGTRNCSTATSNVPVCGCNNKTYQNECFSDADGVKRWTVGACGGGSSASSDPFACAQGTCDTSMNSGQCTTISGNHCLPLPVGPQFVGSCGTATCPGRCFTCPQSSSSASSTPVSASCGNGKVESPEECDDGNTVNGDGCSSTCKKEGSGPSGWYDPDLLDISRATTISYNGNPSGFKDTCRDGTDAFIEEQYTTGGVDVPKVFTEQCPLYTKCVDGACLGVGPTPTASERECTDSDDDPSKPYRGFNIFVAGTAQRGATSDSDLCYQASFGDHFETLLQETYCRRDGQVAHLALRCPSGMTCSNGACQP